MNRIARTLNQYRPTKDMVLVSIMEHHSNDLPHRKHGGKVMHIPVDMNEDKMGCIDMHLLENYLKEFEGRVNYVSVTGISNVTGIINPINDIAELAHKYGAYIIVDAAQLAAQKLAQRATDFGIQEVEIFVKGPGAGRDSAIRAISASGIKVKSIRDVTPVPHNGCRPPKRRRV